jgi:predicted ATPase/class 3 adenylate cyclase
VVDLPIGTVTFLFTDLEGSTRLWEEHPRATRAAVDRHFAILREAIAAHGGHLFRTQGDGACASFALAPDALAAALAAQRRLWAEPWEAEATPRVRMALHTGAAEVRDGDYVGACLNRLARLLAIGHGGQILLSQATYDLVRDTVPEDVGFLNLGQQLLRDLHRPEQVRQLAVDDLPSAFPPLRSLDQRPNNLPTQATALIGREQAVASALERLRRPEARLLTLIGPGGTGKTRLALQVGADALDDFEDGVFFVPLEPIRDPSLLPAAVAQALGLRLSEQRSPADAVRDYLRDKALLLVLDNVEHVIQAAPTVTDLMAACPRLKVLATSRVPLHVRGEQELAVPPLALPDRQHPPPGAALSQYGAVALFIQRALDVDPSFAVTNENAAAVAEICHRLDGLPLAIELAAARTKILTPQEMLARLGPALRALSLLTGGGRDLPARHQTLRNAIAWSCDLLGPAEQVLFGRLAVFVGGFTLEAAEAVCTRAPDGASLRLEIDQSRRAHDLSQITQSDYFQHLRSRARELRRGHETVTGGGEPGPSSAASSSVADSLVRDDLLADGLVLDGLSSLVDNNLLRHDRASAATRFTLLETVREYALERLVASGEAKEVEARHAAYYTSLAEQTEPRLTGPDQVAWLDTLEREHDNLRAALRWLVARGDAVRALRLAGALAAFWWAHGHRDEGRRWLTEILAQPSAAAPTAARARGLLGAAALGASAHDAAQVEPLLRESLAIARELGDRVTTALALQRLAQATISSDDLGGPTALLEESQTIGRELGKPELIAGALAGLALVARRSDDFARARALLSECRRLWREQGDRVNSAHALRSLAVVANLQGDLAGARAFFEVSLALFQEVGDRWNVAQLHGDLGEVLTAHGDYAAARRVYDAGLALWRELGNRQGIANLQNGLAYVVAEQGDHAAARALAEEALAIRRESGSTIRVAWSLACFAYMAATLGQWRRTLRLAGAAAALRRATDFQNPASTLLRLERKLGTAREALGAPASAALWAEGEAMTLEQAVAYALSDAP